jgi:hypothetical protein
MEKYAMTTDRAVGVNGMTAVSIEKYAVTSVRGEMIYCY